MQGESIGWGRRQKTVFMFCSQPTSPHRHAGRRLGRNLEEAVELVRQTRERGIIEGGGDWLL
jgi:hypothetical protein